MIGLTKAKKIIQAYEVSECSGPDWSCVPRLKNQFFRQGKTERLVLHSFTVYSLFAIIQSTFYRLIKGQQYLKNMYEINCDD